jgi:hypothetical protein
MLQVTVKRVGVGVAGASGLLLMGGCAVDAAPPEKLGTAESAVSAGKADLELGYAYQLEGASFPELLVRAPDGTDEYVRVGEELRIRIAQYYLWRFLYPNDYWDTDARLDQLRVEVKVEHQHRGAPVGAPLTVQTTGYQTSPTIGYKEALLAPFTVRAGTDALRFTIIITDTANPQARAEVGFPVLPPVAVFGGDGPNKTLLFDSAGWSAGSTLRTRVLDGGNLQAGGVLALGYTHFRADRVVNVDGISFGETVIGKRKNYGRGGTSIVDIVGKIVHEVAAGLSFDETWRPEVVMLANATSRERSELFPQSTSWPGQNGLQNTYEHATRIPSSATRLRAYFHIKTYLLADYSNQGEVIERKYEQGQKILLREAYDNPSGSGTNYELPVDGGAGPALTRTVIFIKGETRPGQDMFVRGGLDHDLGYSTLGFGCTSSNYLCSMPIGHRNVKNPTTSGWKSLDSFLDWYGKESGQTGDGSAADWTTNQWPSSWGYPRTVAADGYGLEPLNQWGPHYWMLDVDVDCARAYRASNGTRWFDVKSFISNGPGWEGDVHQAGTPYPSRNHVAQCGKLNVFERGSSGAWISDLP